MTDSYSFVHLVECPHLDEGVSGILSEFAVTLVTGNTTRRHVTYRRQTDAYPWEGMLPYFKRHQEDDRPTNRQRTDFGDGAGISPSKVCSAKCLILKLHSPASLHNPRRQPLLPIIFGTYVLKVLGTIRAQNRNLRGEEYCPGISLKVTSSTKRRYGGG